MVDKIMSYLTDTKTAMDFGRIAGPVELGVLAEMQKDFEKQSREYLEESRNGDLEALQMASNTAFKAQLCREAIEASQGASLDLK